MLSDNSWMQHVHLIDADNVIEVDKRTFNNILNKVIAGSTRVPSRSGPAEYRYDADGPHGITLKGHDLLLTDFSQLEAFRTGKLPGMASPVLHY